jgi:hypothetical protein
MLDVTYADSLDIVTVSACGNFILYFSFKKLGTITFKISTGETMARQSRSTESRQKRKGSQSMVTKVESWEYLIKYKDK